MSRKVILFFVLLQMVSCNKLDEVFNDPELDPLEDGFKSCAAVAYCVSIASRAYTGQSLPPNVVYDPSNTDGYSGSGLIYIDVTPEYPLPFNSGIGDIIIAGLWDGANGGVLSILFAEIDILKREFKFHGLRTIPASIRNTGEIVTLFAEQDIVIGEGSETLLNLSLSKPEFNIELDRLNEEKASDVFIAVTQNVWHLSIDDDGSEDPYDDECEVNGGGQIVEAHSSSGGVLYHAMIDTEFSFGSCEKNPTHGTAFIQNIQAGSAIDFGTILMDFHSNCDGKAEVTLATGKYVSAHGRDISLPFD